MALFTFGHVYLPYCLEKQSDGSYAVLNREYKPVGFNTREWIRYEEYPVTINLKITPTIAAKLSSRGDPNIDRIYLYDDGCVPFCKSGKHTDAYLDKLKYLIKLNNDLMSEENQSRGITSLNDLRPVEP
jgi:hypothetical protein